MLEKDPRPIDSKKYPNLLQMRLPDFLGVFRSMYPNCPKCKKARNKICFRHEFLEHKLAYIAQELYGFNFGVKFEMDRHGPVAEVISRFNREGVTDESILVGKERRAQLSTEEQRFLRTFFDFFTKWDLTELGLLTTEHMLKARSPSGAISIKELTPLLKLIVKVASTSLQLQRWQIKKTIRPQSLAEHLYNVTFISMLLSDLLYRRGFPVNPEEVIRKAILHDLEEVAVGFDVPTPIKHGNERTRHIIEQLSYTYLEVMFKELPEAMRKEYLALVRESSSLEHGTVQIADKLEALIFALEEAKLGNRDFEDVILDKVKFLKEIKSKILRCLTLPIIKYLVFKEYGGCLRDDLKDTVRKLIDDAEA
jgi:5'-deoxynucleotidase YfbR-like HD superfamily hydrolase